MSLFSGPKQSVKDERVVMEYYKAGHLSYVIIILLILLDYLVRGVILGHPEYVKTHLFLIAIPAFYFMITLVRKGVWMSGLSKNRKIMYFIITGIAILIFNIIEKVSTGYLSSVKTEKGWFYTLLILIFIPVMIGVSTIFVFMKIAERKEAKLLKNADD